MFFSVTPNGIPWYWQSTKVKKVGLRSFLKPSNKFLSEFLEQGVIIYTMYSGYCPHHCWPSIKVKTVWVPLITKIKNDIKSSTTATVIENTGSSSKIQQPAAEVSVAA